MNKKENNKIFIDKINEYLTWKLKNFSTLKGLLIGSLRFLNFQTLKSKKGDIEILIENEKIKKLIYFEFCEEVSFKIEDLLLVKFEKMENYLNNFLKKYKYLLICDSFDLDILKFIKNEIWRIRTPKNKYENIYYSKKYNIYRFFELEYENQLAFYLRAKKIRKILEGKENE